MVKKEQKIQTADSLITSSSMLSKKKYKGVRMRSWGSWVSEIRAPNQKTRIWLGSYSTPEAAARAYDAALLCVKGPNANLNFSDIQYHHDYPTTIMSPKSIQKIAAAAANTASAVLAANTATVVLAANTATSTSQSPPSPSPSYSSSVSSSSTTPPPTNLIEEHEAFFSADDPLDGTLMSMVAPWYNLDSPSYNDGMFDKSFFEFDHSYSSIMDDVYEEDGGDIYLWSFCR